MGNKAFYMTGLELGLLLDSEGSRRCCCFDLQLENKLSRENVIHAIHSMMKRKWIIVEKNRIQARDEIAELMEYIRTAYRILQFCAKEKSALIYMSEQTAAVSVMGDDCFRIQKLAYGEVFEWMAEESSLQELAAEEPEAEEAWGNSRISEERNKLKMGELSVCLSLALVKVLDVSGNEAGNRVHFLKGLLNDWIVVETQSGTIESVSIDCREMRERLLAGWKEMKNT